MSINKCSFNVALTLLDLCYKKEINISLEDFEHSKNNIFAKKMMHLFAITKKERLEIEHIETHTIWKQNISALAVDGNYPDLLAPITLFSNKEQASKDRYRVEYLLM